MAGFSSAAFRASKETIDRAKDFLQPARIEDEGIFAAKSGPAL
jgi:hypothetical protein